MSKFVYFTGPCKWAKVYTPDDYNGEKKWKIDVFLSKSDLKDLKATGLKLKVKEEEETGSKYVTFNRPVVKEIKGEMVDFDAPRVLNKDKEDITDLIGNGSTVTVKVLVYDSAMGPGHRLEAVRVDNLVQYSADPQEGEF